MARPLPPAEMEFPGADSFLDVVTNIVGILIILVVVVGARARNATWNAHDSDAGAEELSKESSHLAALESDARRAAGQVVGLEREIVTRSMERTSLGTLIAASEMDINHRRAALDAKSRKQYDLNRKIAAAREALYQLQADRSQVASARAPAVTVESYPTPLSRTVVGKEAHFQIKQGRICYIPIDTLLERFKSVFREKAMRLKDETELVDTVGPVQGFRMRYMLERFDIPVEGFTGGARGGSYVAMTRWELVPVSGLLGEALSAAIEPDSDFRNRLAGIHPHQYTVTLWVYEDSFAEFRQVRKELYQLGYSVAGRPLPKDTPIGGSPKGSKSAAE